MEEDQGEGYRSSPYRRLQFHPHLPVSAPHVCSKSQVDTNPEAVVAVVGCGPVGLMAILAARFLGAQRIVAIDSVPARLDLAKEFGAQPVSLDADPGTVIKTLTQGRGADVVLELVGGSAPLQLAFNLARPFGTLSSIGVHAETAAFPFTPAAMYDKNLTLRCGRCPARGTMPAALQVLRAPGLDPTRIITHRVPLERAAEAYRMFDAKEDRCIKVVFRVA